MKKHFWNAVGVSTSFALMTASYVAACWQLDLMRDVICTPCIAEPMDLWKIDFGFPWIHGTVFMPLQRAWDLTMIGGGIGLLLTWLILFVSLWWWEE